LSCGKQTTALTSANLYEERVFRWAPGQCQSVSLSVVFPQGELKRQWLGDDAWPRFLQELASGEHRYALEAFEAADPLVFSLQGVNEILVRFSLEGHERALERWRAWQQVRQAMAPVRGQISALQDAAKQHGNYFTGNLTALPVSAVQCRR
jgi:type VI secretion system protein ImpL